MTMHNILSTAADRASKGGILWYVTDPDGEPGAHISAAVHMPHGLSHIGHFEVVELADGRIEMTWIDTQAGVTVIVDRRHTAVLAQLININNRYGACSSGGGGGTYAHQLG